MVWFWFDGKFLLDSCYLYLYCTVQYLLRLQYSMYLYKNDLRLRVSFFT